MRKIIAFMVITFFAASASYAQFDEDQFLQRVNSIYHSLANTGLKNFSAELTSDHFKAITGKLDEEKPYYPLEFIWAAPDRMFFIKKAPPEKLNAAQIKKIDELQQELQPELRGILLDWQRFMAGRLLTELPQTHRFEVVGDTVHLIFKQYADAETTAVNITFGRNGICLKISANDLIKKRKTLTYPAYRLVDGKWLCTGWDVQIENNGEISGGFRVLIKSIKIETLWFPWDLRLIVQTKEKLNHTFVRNYNFRNIQLNRSIKIVN